MGSARTDQNFTSVTNMRRWMVLFIYLFFFSFEFIILLTLFKNHLISFFVVNMYQDTADTTFFLKVSEKERL